MPMPNPNKSPLPLRIRRRIKRHANVIDRLAWNLEMSQEAPASIVSKLRRAANRVRRIADPMPPRKRLARQTQTRRTHHAQK